MHKDRLMDHPWLLLFERDNEVDRLLLHTTPEGTQWGAWDASLRHWKHLFSKSGSSFEPYYWTDGQVLSIGLVAGMWSPVRQKWHISCNDVDLEMVIHLLQVTKYDSDSVHRDLL